MPAAAKSSSLPLCVDLDGTLLRSDSLWESFFALFRKNPAKIFLVPFWLLEGKAQLKHHIAENIKLDVDRLPYTSSFLTYLRGEHEKGRVLVLVTAADQAVAEHIAAHLGIFQKVFGSGHGVNLSGDRKAALLVRTYGEKGFDYAGNEKHDLEVWKHARHAIVVNATDNFVASVRRLLPVERVFDDRKSEVASLLRAMRPHQWLKNLLIFVPLLTAHRLTDPFIFRHAFVAFICFCFVTSSIYLLNDLLDLSADRLHQRKKQRSLAAGDLSLPFALTMVPLLLLCGLALSFILPPVFQLVLLFYILTTVAYTLLLKQIVLLDVFILAGLYTIRIIAGHTATAIEYSFWLLVFSLFLFVSLAFLKRYSELDMLTREQRTASAGRGYVTGDKEQVGMFGATSGYLAILVMALYVNSMAVTRLYRHPALLWIIFPLMLYWISRLWLLAHRGRVHDDPIIFTLKDPVSYIVGVLVVGVMVMAT